MHKINFPQYYVVLNDNFGWPTEVVAGPFYHHTEASLELNYLVDRDMDKGYTYSIGIKNLELEF